jgi:hypothetical protein
MRGILGAIIVALGLFGAGVAIGGIYAIVPGMTGSAAGGSVYVVNRLTGFARFCIPGGCRTLGSLRTPPPDPPAFDPSKPFTVVPPSQN